MHEREHGDRRGGLFFGFLNAGEFAVDFGANGFFAREQFLSTGAHGLKNVMRVDLVQWPRWSVRGLRAGNFDDQMRGDECLQNLLDETAGDAEFVGHFLSGWRTKAALKALTDAGHESESDELAATLVNVFRDALLEIQ